MNFTWFYLSICLMNSNPPIPNVLPLSNVNEKHFISFNIKHKLTMQCINHRCISIALNRIMCCVMLCYAFIFGYSIVSRTHIFNSCVKIRSASDMTLKCIHNFIVTSSFLYWCVMRPISQRFFIHSCIYLCIFYHILLSNFSWHCRSVLMCRKEVNQSINQSVCRWPNRAYDVID